MLKTVDFKNDKNLYKNHYLYLTTLHLVFFSSRAVNQLNGFELEGKPLKVELAVEKRQRRGPRGPGGAAFGGLPGQSRQTDFPLRILVQSDMVSNSVSEHYTHFVFNKNQLDHLK